MNNQSDWGYALFSAHIHHYFPQLSWDQHPDQYACYLDYHQARSLDTQEHWELDSINFLGDTDPAIICLFHLGYHGQIPRLLAQQGIVFDIILDKQVYEAQREELEAMRIAMQTNGADYRFLLADDPTVLWKAKAALREGRHLIVFADGQTAGKDSLDQKIKVDFLASSIYVPKGIALLSFLLKVSIFALSHIDLGPYKSLLTAYPICPTAVENRDSYCYRCMQRLYHFLAAQIQQEAWRWESWRYLHRQNCLDYDAWMPISSQPVADDSCIALSLNNKKGLFSRKQFCYIYD